MKMFDYTVIRKPIKKDEENGAEPEVVDSGRIYAKDEVNAALKVGSKLQDVKGLEILVRPFA